MSDVVECGRGVDIAVESNPERMRGITEAQNRGTRFFSRKPSGGVDSGVLSGYSRCSVGSVELT